MSECALTELDESMCACPKHRGGQTPQEQVTAERLRSDRSPGHDVRGVDTTSQLSPKVFAAKFPGRCIADCGEPIQPDQMIVGDSRMGHGYMHVECAP